MKKVFAITTLSLLASCMPAESVQMSAAEQDELAAVLRGRTADTPVSCVNQRDLRNNRSIGDSAIVFDGPNGILYVNHPALGCPRLDVSRALVTKTFGTTQLCRGDIVTVIDPVNGTSYGGCGLGDFTPYRKRR